MHTDTGPKMCPYMCDALTPCMCDQVGSATVRLQEDAKSIKEALTVAHSEHKSRQTTKILSDFEVSHTLSLPALRC